MEPKPILLAEDSLQDAELTREALSRHGLAGDVVHMQDGAQALDYLYRRGPFALREAGEPAVILLDLKMPKVDGLEVLRTIKRDERFKTIPVVVLTSSRQERDLEQSYALGANAYVVKPVEFRDYLKTVGDTSAFWAQVNEPPLGSLRRRGEPGRGRA